MILSTFLNIINRYTLHIVCQMKLQILLLLLEKYQLMFYSMPSTVLGPKDRMVNEGLGL